MVSELSMQLLTGIVICVKFIEVNTRTILYINIASFIRSIGERENKRAFLCMSKQVIH